jgi:predicted homoserine dehydrogenase-like protein
MTRTGLGIVGTGFIAEGLARMIRRSHEFGIAAVLTRRRERPVQGFSEDELTDSIDELLDRSSIVVECSGDPVHATVVIDRAINAGLPVITMNSEWHVTAGSHFRGRGLITEAEGDQPGCLAALHEEAMAMGFQPLVYGNVKGFLDRNPSRAQMEAHGSRQGLSLSQVTSFTDGTKVQIEQALVANGLGAGIARTGLLGPAVANLEECTPILAAAAETLGMPIADYVLTRDTPGGVFIIAQHDESQARALSYMKLGNGPYYLLKRPHHLCHLEIIKTLRRILGGGGVLLDNGSKPAISVAAVAKRELLPGLRIGRGTGSFDVRGECIRIAESGGHVPIGLMQEVVLRKRVAAGDFLTMDDVDLPESLALTAWLETSLETIRMKPPL